MLTACTVCGGLHSHRCDPPRHQSSSIRTTPEGYGLCFVDECWAYFASVPPDEMWGDDWNDAPHHCNAGTPYPREGVSIVKVAYDGDWELVGTIDRSGTVLGAFGYLSAEQINSGAHPWLVTVDYGQLAVDKKIAAGVTLQAFRRLIAEGKGRVYEARNR